MDLITVVWVTGLSMLAGSLAFEFGGPVTMVAVVGGLWAVLGLAADVLGLGGK